MISEKGIVKVFTLRAQDLLIDGFFVTNLRLCLSELDIRRHHVRVLRLVEFISVLELFFEYAQIGPTLLQSGHILFRDLRSDLRRQHGAI